MLKNQLCIALTSGESTGGGMIFSSHSNERASPSYRCKHTLLSDTRNAIINFV